MNKPKRVCNMFKYGLFDSQEHKFLEQMKPTKLQFVNADPGCFIGIEVEVERAEPLNLLLWNSTTDGSLRNSGYEYVSHPIRGKLVEYALNELSEALRANCPKHEFTDRTSVHIHVNVRHLEVEQLTNFILLYLALEPVFFKFTEKIPNIKRKENNYCVPLQDSKSYLRLFEHLGTYYKTKDPQAVYNAIINWKKYTAFNLLPIQQQGTLEFRHMGGTMDVSYIMDWINMILSMRRFARENSLETIKKLLFELNTTSSYGKFIYDVLGKELDIPFNDLVPLVEDSIASTKDVFVLLSLPEYEQHSVKSIMESSFGQFCKNHGIKFSYRNGVEKKQNDIDKYEKAIKQTLSYIRDLKEPFEDQDDLPEDIVKSIAEYDQQIDSYKVEIRKLKALLEKMSNEDDVSYTAMRSFRTPYNI